MLSKIRKSLVLQTSFLFFVSFIVIALLWVFFYIKQKAQHLEYDKARYFNTASSLQSSLHNNTKITNKQLEVFGMKVFDELLPITYEVELKKGDLHRGFEVINTNSKQLIKIYNDKNQIILEDISSHRSMVLIHLVFMLLLITQGLIYMKVQRSLSPLSRLHNKLKKLKVGDLSPLSMDSKYVEIQQMITSYNDSISKIEQMLEVREMFNKIFMHEMKMPLAKGMFYLKQEPSEYTHEKLSNILHGLNDELNEFSQIESLIAYQNRVNKDENKLLELIEIAKSRVFIENKKIDIQVDNKCKLKGDKEFWVLCIKNLLDNALKYSSDGLVTIKCEQNSVSFINKGEELPVDISKDIKKWKIDKNKRHKSSTGYGFGLFIIKNIVLIHGYKLEYIYDEKNSLVTLKIV